MLVLTEMSEITASSSTLTTEEWKAEQQLERDAQASYRQFLSRMRGLLVGCFEVKQPQRASVNLRTAKCDVMNNNSTARAWPGSRLETKRAAFPPEAAS